MKNIPIIGKFGAILAVFGVFAIAVAFYSTTQMRTLNTGYLAMRAGPTDALLQLIRSNVDIQFIREDSTDAMAATDAATVQKDLAAVKTDSARFAQFMGLAATDDPADADAIQTREIADSAIRDRGLHQSEPACRLGRQHQQRHCADRRAAVP